MRQAIGGYQFCGIPYAIFYRIANDELLVLHIRHTSRRPVSPDDVL
jgi:plasmid stabilization system protein ParE